MIDSQEKIKVQHNDKHMAVSNLKKQNDSIDIGGVSLETGNVQRVKPKTAANGAQKR